MQRCFAYIRNIAVKGDDEGCWIVVNLEATGGGLDGLTMAFVAGIEHLSGVMNMLGVFSLAELSGQIVRIEIDGQTVVAMAGSGDQPWIPWINAGPCEPAGNENELQQ